MRLPLSPQDHTAVKARFAGALVPVCDIEEIIRHPEKRPSDKPQHVFDVLPENIRMIVSMDKLGSRTLLHFSFSLFADTNIKSRQTFQAACHSLILEFVGLLQHVDELWTPKAFHVFVLPTGQMCQWKKS